MQENQFAILCPCYNEGETILKFAKEVFSILKTLTYQFDLIIVDDASNDETPALLKAFKNETIENNITILQLTYNLGHQGAIYQGLLYLHEKKYDYAIIMDSDGEDDPVAIKSLINYLSFDIVHVVRGKRKESLFFKISYFIYKIIFKIITKKDMNFGNYCMINKKIISSLVDTSFIHLAAHLSKLRVNSTRITSNRQKRIDGKSKMSLNSLIFHAFKSFIEYAEELLMLFLRMFVILFIIFLCSIVYIVYLKVFTQKAILGWASNLSANFFNAAILSIGFFVIGILLLNLSQFKNSNKQKKFDVID